MSSKNFDAYAAYYDLLYADKDYKKEAKFVVDLIEKVGNGGTDIIELGCGTGVHAAYLASVGFDILGLDKSSDMLDLARKRAREATTASAKVTPQFIKADIRQYEVERKFDIGLALFDVVSYLTTTEDLRSMISATTRHLRSGGVIVFDCWYGPAVFAQRPAIRIKRMENDAFRVVRIAEPVFNFRESLVTVNFEVFVEHKAFGRIESFNEQHPMRCYFETELDLLMCEAGLRRLATTPWHTDKPPNEESWSVIFCYGKS